MRSLCTTAKPTVGRTLHLLRQAEHEALERLDQYKRQPKARSVIAVALALKAPLLKVLLAVYDVPAIEASLRHTCRIWPLARRLILIGYSTGSGSAISQNESVPI